MWGRAITALTCTSVLSAASVASAAELRFRETAAGNVIATGNTLGLSKALDLNGPGTEDSIGTFLTLDDQSVDDFPASPANPWGAGTTFDWTSNSSEAELVLPGDNTTVLYAELIWGGSSFYGTEDVRGDLETPVTLSFGNDEISVSPDPATELTIEEISASGGFPVNFYMRSADVTDFVAEHGAGFYATAGVPATQDSLIDELNAAGWTLVVAYRTAGQRIRNLTIFVGGSYVDEDATEDYEFSGFCTPPQGDFIGNIVVSAMEGDADRDGDSLAIAQSSVDAFTTLEGPNNPENNFFCSQLNDPDGNLDTAGTAGDANHDAILADNIVGGRQSWDITRVPVSSQDNHLVNGQTEAVVRTQTADDSYIPTVVAFGIEVNAPDFSGAEAAADPEVLMLEQTSTITVDMENVGLVDATGLTFQAPLPDGLALESFSIDGNAGDVDGNPVDAAALAAGVAVGDIGVTAAAQLEIVVRAEGAPTDDSGDFIITPQWQYDYVSCTGDPALTEPLLLADIVIEFDGDEDPTTGGGADDSSGDSAADGSTSDSDSDSNGDASASITAGETGDSDTDGGSDSLGGGDVSDSDGCGCQSGSDSPLWSLGLFGLVALRRRRRR